MELIYKNFDGLDISFQGALSEDVLETLADGKREAQQMRKDVYRELGPEKIPVMVAETGMRGGYAYRFDTGPDGEIWAIGHSTKSDSWNIRVSVKSLNLALRGYQAVKDKILALLEALGATGPPQREEVTGAVKNFPQERISRFDVCFDFLALSAFEPDPKRFVAHSRSNRHYNGTDNGVRTYTGAKGKVIESARIGEMPNRQVCLYNKSREVEAHNKRYWHDIWREAIGAIYSVEEYSSCSIASPSIEDATIDNDTIEDVTIENDTIGDSSIGSSPIESASIQRQSYKSPYKSAYKDENDNLYKQGTEKLLEEGTVWRLEARAGKEELNTWNLRTFEDFEAKAGDVIESILYAIRYVEPNGEDSNPARWPLAGFWQSAIDASVIDLANYRSEAVRRKIITDYRDNIIKGYKDRISGNIIGLIAALGRDLSELPEILEEVETEMLDYVDQNPGIAQDKFEKLGQRFAFIGEGE